MKKLSEIGKTLSRHPVDGGMIPFDPKLEEKHTLHIYTPAERQELVREAVLRWNSYSRNVDEPSIEDFLEEQGL